MQNHDNWSTICFIINFCSKIIVAFNGIFNLGNENDEHDGTLAIIFINIFFVNVFTEDEKNNFRGLFTYDFKRDVKRWELDIFSLSKHKK